MGPIFSSCGSKSTEVNTDDPLHVGEKTGCLGKWNFCKSDTPLSKGWFIAAVSVGSFVVIGIGGFGVMGLLHSHALVNLPSCLTAALNTLGQTPHSWSLWAITVGGVVVGSALISYGSYKIHQARKLEKARVEAEEFRQEEIRKTLALFGNHFTEVGVEPGNFEELTSSQYTDYVAAPPDEVERKDFFLMIRLSEDSELLCTPRLTKEERDGASRVLDSMGYTFTRD